MHNKLKDKKTLNRIFSVIYMLILTLPMVFGFFINHNKTILTGVEAAGASPAFSASDYWDGNFQSKFDDWANKAYYGRDNLVKTYNQVRYSLFSLGDKTIIKGKNGYLFGSSYVDDYLGLKPELVSSDDYLDKLTNYLRDIQDRLSEQGKAFVFIITPSKATFYSAYIPDRFYMQKHYSDTEDSNYSRLEKLLKQKGIVYIDSVQILKDLDALHYPLFTKTGTHWTRTATMEVIDDLLDLLEKRNSYNLRTYNIDGYSKSSVPENTDIDIYSLLNLYEKNYDESYYYPIVESDMENKFDEPSVLWQGGSFSWQMMDMLNGQNIITDLTYVSYGNYFMQFPIKNNKITLGGFSEEKLNSVLSGKDIFILECNEQYINNYCPELKGYDNAQDDFVGFMHQYLSAHKLSDEKIYPVSIEFDTGLFDNSTVLLKNKAIKYNGLTINMTVPKKATNTEPNDNYICVYINDILTEKIPCGPDQLLNLNIPAKSLSSAENDIYKIRVQLPENLLTDKTNLNFNNMLLKITFHYIGDTK